MKGARLHDGKNPFLRGRRIQPPAISGTECAAELIDNAFLAFNAGRLREACELYTQKMLAPEATVGLALSGAMTPAGLGCSCLVPLIEAGFVDWIVSTGANIYHDLHFAFNMPLHAGSPQIPDTELRGNRIVRIYDIFLHYDNVLLATDAVLRDILKQPEFQKEMGTAELYAKIGRYAAEYEARVGLKGASVTAAAYRAGVPIFTSSPGDSTIGMNIAGLALRGNRLKIDPSIDVNQTAAVVLGSRHSRQPTRNGRVKGTHGTLIVGGGSPKNFMLQTEPQIQEILGIPDAGHDYYLQFTDARPDSGGLSGATPGEAVTWGKVDPSKLPDMIVCYLDTSVALPLLTAYALRKRRRRPLRRLYDRLSEFTASLEREYAKHAKTQGF
jgi:deoxyhypusine synthase